LRSFILLVILVFKNFLKHFLPHYSLMKISIIIPAHNEEDVIERNLKSVFNSSFKNFEVIVVNDGSTDKTASIVGKFKKVKLINHKKPRGPAGARNHGARVASGGVLFFLDADDWVNKNTLKTIVDSFKKHKVKAVIGNIDIQYPKDWTRIWLYKFTDWCVLHKTEMVSDYGSCPYIVDRKLFFEVGGFVKNSFYFEDYLTLEKYHKKGVKVLANKSLHYNSDMGASFKDYFKRAKNIGKGMVLSRVYDKLIRLLLTTAVLSLILISPLLFFSYYSLFAVYWLNKKRDLLIALTAPGLFFIEKFISLFYVLKTLFKSFL